MRLTDGKLQGRTVIGADGQALGMVSALYLDSASWRVESLQVRLVKEVAERIGVSHGFFHAGLVEIPVRLIQSAGDTVVLSVTADALREVLPSDEEGVQAP